VDTITASQARAKLDGFLDEAAASRRPILITGKRSNAVLISEDDWRTIQETLIFCRFPGCASRLWMA